MAETKSSTPRGTRNHMLCGCIVTCIGDVHEPAHEPRISYCLLHRAAPDLLAALEELTVMAERNNYHGMDLARDRARAAIAKAK